LFAFIGVHSRLPIFYFQILFILSIHVDFPVSLTSSFDIPCPIFDVFAARFPVLGLCFVCLLFLFVLGLACGGVFCQFPRCAASVAEPLTVSCHADGGGSR
jgi:hypothetical protein